MYPTIQIKGIREGLLLTLTEGGTWEEAQQAILEHLDQQAEFLRGARLALNLGERTLNVTELSKLRSEISERGVSLWAVLSLSPKTEDTAQTLGLATKISKPAPRKTTQQLETTIFDGENAILVQRTLRSGYNLTYPGHVTVIGDINPGAEIIASGNIIVWGHLRGLVHAGAEGNIEAIVCALDLSPTQLRIAGQIANINKKSKKIQPEIAFLENKQVVVEPWKSKKGK
jgi:septum site-determining protein MinC